MLGRRVTPERRAQMARQALEEIRAFRVRLDRLDKREPPAPWALLDRLARKVSRAWLDRWEQRERKVIREFRGL